MSVPISNSVLRRHLDLRKEFESDAPLPAFTIIPQFLKRDVAIAAAQACARARLSTYCVYKSSTTSDKLHQRFCEPTERFIYVSVHQRLRRSVATLEQLDGMFNEAATLRKISELTAIEVSNATGSLLTCWGPGCFVQPHTDFFEGSTTKLVLSLSLTREWDPQYGGTAVYAWKGSDRAVRFTPRLNTAVIFKPHAGSWHWVEQVSNDAPTRCRLTWTTFFS